ncbi:MAG: HDOD domain-containing protein, partial [Myxococcota bacterium]
MPGPHVMVIDDDPLLVRAVRRAVRRMRPDWTIAVAASPAEAFAALNARPADVIIADTALARHDGGMLFTELARLYPETLRVLFTTDPDARSVPELSAIAHRIVPKGPSPRVLVAAVDDALTSRAWLDSDELRRVVFGARELPRAPEIAPRLARVARDPRARVKDLADVVSRDPAVVARVLRIASSVWFSGSRKLRSVEEAIARVGVRTLQALVLDTEIAHRFHIDPRSGVSPDTLARRSLWVARIALQIAEDVVPPLAESAFLAAVVHDIGQLVLADQDPERIGRDLELSQRSGTPLH